jgi:hypothetical protein
MAIYRIVTANGAGYVSVFNHAGDLDWAQQPTGQELRSLATDLDADGDLEIIVASTRSEDQWWVYTHDGILYPSHWPELSADSPGYKWGCYNENLAAGDVDGDGRGGSSGPNDTHYIDAFHDDGSQMAASPIYGAGKFWSQVGACGPAVDLRVC